MKRKSARKEVISFLTSGLTLAIVTMVTLPLLWTFLLSLKTRVDALASPPVWVFSPTAENYRATFIQGRELDSFVNSLIIAASSTILAMAVSVPAAYSFSRFRFAGKDQLLISILAVRMLPATVVALPLFLIFTKIEMLDSYYGIVVVHSALACPIAVWLMRVFFDSVPTTVDDASRLDGASWGSILVFQILPLALPGVLIATAFCFLNSWNELSLSLVLTGSHTKPLSVAVPSLVTPHGTYWGRVTAISTIGLLPAIIAVLLSRRFLATGLAEGTSWR
jgi:multiple sugar transport system permease protein